MGRAPCLCLPHWRESLAEDLVLDQLGDRELDGLLGGDLEGLAGLDVAAGASLALDDGELAETGEREGGLLGLLGNQVGEGRIDVLDGLLGVTRGIGDGVNDLRLGEGLGRGLLFGSHVSCTPFLCDNRFAGNPRFDVSIMEVLCLDCKRKIAGWRGFCGSRGVGQA